MSKMSYLILMDDVLGGKIDPDSIEPRYILMGSGKLSIDKFLEGVNFMAKFGWRTIGYNRYLVGHRSVIDCLMEKME